MCGKLKKLYSLLERRKRLCATLSTFQEVAYDVIFASGVSQKLALKNAIMLDVIEASIKLAIVIADETMVVILTSGETK